MSMVDELTIRQPGDDFLCYSAAAGQKCTVATRSPASLYTSAYSVAKHLEWPPLQPEPRKRMVPFQGLFQLRL